MPSKTTKAVLAGLALTTVFTAANSFKIVPAQSYGVRIKMGQLVDDQLKPNFYFKLPVFDSISVFPNNTIIMHCPKAGDGRNTQDQNVFTANLRFHYAHDPKVGLVALHAKTMQKNNGEDFLQELVKQSVNATVGARRSTDTLADPENFLKAMAENMQWRIAQNNLPMKFMAFELLSMQIGDGATPYTVPVQYRIIPHNDKEWKIEKMAGPAAVPVQQAGQTVEPSSSSKIVPATPQAPAPAPAVM